jgi:hypothetical protein
MGKEPIVLVLRLSCDLDQMITKAGMAGGGEDMQTVEQQIVSGRQERDAFAEFPGERINRWSQLVGMVDRFRQRDLGIGRPEVGDDVVGFIGAL